MSIYDISQYPENIFESIMRINEAGQEFWSGRELAKILDYKDYRNFEATVYKAMEACKNSGNVISDHFGEVTEMIEIGKGARRPIQNYHLSRYACYLIVMNSDPQKEVIALGQTYFAVKTRQQEIIENYDELTDDQKRLAIRQEMRDHKKSLASAAKEAGVVQPIDYAIFQNKGYQGLYGGLTRNQIYMRKGLKGNQDILDHMGHEELAANLFRATQTESKLKRDKIRGIDRANQTHFDVGRKVRKTISELGGTMPENLPTPEKSIKELERKQKKLKDKNPE
jgi:DNA-damage-inducible protein D